MVTQPSQTQPLTRHILPTSATMVGVCVTVMSLSKSIYGAALGSLLSQILSVDSMLFMVSATLSYLSIRAWGPGIKLEQHADTAFIVGLALMCVIGLLQAFELL